MIQADVLIVEDNRANTLLVKKLLEKHGWSAVEASDGKEAVERCKQRQFRLVLMDIQMPLMDGFEATRLIRELEREREVENPAVIIALTAYAMESDRDRCYAAGMDDYITKPIHIQIFLEKIRNYLGEDNGEDCSNR